MLFHDFSFLSRPQQRRGGLHSLQRTETAGCSALRGASRPWRAGPSRAGRETLVELVAAEPDVLAASLLALGDDPGGESALKWWLAVDFVTGSSIWPHLQLARAEAPGELAHDLEPDRVGQRLKHGQPVDLVEVGARRPAGWAPEGHARSVINCLTTVEQYRCTVCRSNNSARELIVSHTTLQIRTIVRRHRQADQARLGHAARALRRALPRRARRLDDRRRAPLDPDRPRTCRRARCSGSSARTCSATAASCCSAAAPPTCSGGGASS